MWGEAACSRQREVIQRRAPEVKTFIYARTHRHRPLGETERAQLDEVASPRQSRAYVLGDEEDLWMGQSVVPRPGEDYPRVVYLLRFGESARGATAAAGRDVGSVCPEAGSEPADGGCTPRKGFRASGCPPNSPS